MASVYMCVDAERPQGIHGQQPARLQALTCPGPIAAPPARSARAAPARRRAAASPADFPKVDSAQQKRARQRPARDPQRGNASEEKKLAELRREYNNGEPERHGDEKNYAKYQERVVADERQHRAAPKRTSKP